MLNVRLGPQVPCYKNSDPTLIDMETFHGKRVAFDPNSLALFRIDDDRDFSDLFGNPPNPHVKAEYIPNPPFSKSVRPRRLKFKLTGRPWCDGEVLSFSDIRMTIDRNFVPGETNRIDFIGGEPLLEMDTILETWAYVTAKAGGAPVQFTIWTPLYAIRPKQLAWLNRHQFNFVVLLYGNREHDDREFDGERIHDRVMKNLKLLRFDDVPNRTTLYGVYEPISVVSTFQSLRERYEYLNQLVEDGYGNEVYLVPEPLSEFPIFDPNEFKDIDLLVQYQEVAEWYVDRINRGRLTYAHDIGTGIARLMFGLHKWTECDAGIGSISVCSNGSLFACTDAVCIGSLESGGFIERNRYQWVDNRVYYRQPCADCDIRWWCGGGCRRCSMLQEGAVKTVNQFDCEYRQALFRVVCYVMRECSANSIIQCSPEVKAVRERVMNAVSPRS